MITLTILSILSVWVSLGLFAKITGQECNLDIAERIATALEWYRTLLGLDRETREASSGS